MRSSEPLGARPTTSAAPAAARRAPDAALEEAPPPASEGACPPRRSAGDFLSTQAGAGGQAEGRAGPGPRGPFAIPLSGQHRAQAGLSQTPGDPRRAAPVWATLLAGAVAGGVAKTAVAPLDRLKIMAQVGALPWRGALLVPRQLRDTWRREGMQGLWRGNTATVLRVVPYAAIHYSVHEALEGALRGGRDKPSTAAHFAAGAGAGAAATLATYPMDLLRARMAVALSSSPAARPRLSHLALEMYRHEGGAASLFRGLGPTLLGIVPYSGVTWLTYETLKEMTAPGAGEGEAVPNHATKVACGMLAGLVGQSLTYPLDVVRRRMQVDPASAGMWGAYQETVRRGGAAALFRGLSLNWFKGPIATSISLTTFEYIKHHYQR